MVFTIGGARSSVAPGQKNQHNRTGGRFLSAIAVLDRLEICWLSENGVILLIAAPWSSCVRKILHFAHFRQPASGTELSADGALFGHHRSGHGKFMNIISFLIGAK